MSNKPPPKANYGPFQLIRRVSLGGMAEVFRARVLEGPSHDSANDLVAVKRLLPHAAEDAEIVQMFEAEARLAMQLDHPRICRVHDLGQYRDSHYISMEYVAGRDLRRFQRRFEQGESRMEPVAVAAVGYQVAEGLGYAHSFVNRDGVALNIIHRDISPTNLVVASDGRLKIVDFGIAMYEGKELQTRGGIVKGKHAYMSPEQVRREPLDGRSDLFSLGIILYELLTATRLFRGETFHDTLEQVAAAEVPPLAAQVPDLPPPLVATVMGCLARDRHDRPPNARAVADACWQALRGVGEDSPERPLAQLYLDLFGVESFDPDEESKIDTYLASLCSAEDRGEETTDQRGATDITLVYDG